MVPGHVESQYVDDNEVDVHEADVRQQSDTGVQYRQCEELYNIESVRNIVSVEYNIVSVRNCMSEYKSMNLNMASEVTKAHLPSLISWVTHYIPFLLLQVNGAATEA